MSTLPNNSPRRADRILLYTVSAVVLLLSCWTILRETRRSSLVYVDIGKLLEQYQFRKDMEQASTQNLYQIKHVVDSLKMLQKVSNDPVLAGQAAHAEQAFDQYYTQSSQETSKKVWERLNPLLEQYGKDKKLDLVIGANGAGTVLYGSSQSDVTADVITYVNSKYAKGN